jgi:alpha-1,2-mannosyltransferase
MFISINKFRNDRRDSTRERRPFETPALWLWLLLTLLGSSPSLLLFAQDLLDLRGMNLISGHVWGRDFVNVWTGGHLAIEGRADMIYALQDYVAYLRNLVGPLDPHYYSYPPSTLLLAAPFGLLPYSAALALWTAGGLAVFIWASRPYIRDVPNFPILYAVITPAALINVWAGHYGFLVGALWLACFARIERRPGAAGAFAALLTIKPHLGLLLPPLLLARRKWRTIVVAAAGSLAMLLASGAVFGFDLWTEYATEMSSFQASLLERKRSFFLLMPGTFTSVRYGGGSPPAAWLAHICVALVAALVVWRAERKGASLTDLAFISATATFLILPYAFGYDMTVVSLGFALMLFRHWGNLPSWQRAALIGGYLSPQMSYLGKFVAAPIAPAVLLLGLYAQFRLCTREPQPE